MKHISIILADFLGSIGLPGIDKLATMPYEDYLQTDHWYELRRKALKRANYKCQKCYHQDHLQIHHLTYERRGLELPEDLIVLCSKCHKKNHGIK